MQLNIDKSYFTNTEVEYLGYIINSEGTKSQPSEVQIIVDMPRPKTVKQIKRSTGMINLYCDV